MCWIIAFGLLFSESIDRNDMFMKLLFAMGFILVGAVCKLVDAYREVHKPDTDDKYPSQNKTIEDL
jgi:hypothetical protein